MSNKLDPDEDPHSVGPDLGPNCLLKCYKQTKKSPASKERVKFSLLIYEDLTLKLLVCLFFRKNEEM